MNCIHQPYQAAHTGVLYAHYADAVKLVTAAEKILKQLVIDVKSSDLVQIAAKEN
jgi:hypothetical protein